MRALVDRFWEKVEKAGPDDCWLWLAAKSDGYGVISVGPHETSLAHRVSWELAFGPLDPKVELDHKCLNRPCVNPSHLRIADHSKNAMNTRKRASNRSGFKGVSWHAGAKKWRATIFLNKVQTHLGFFLDPSAAHDAYCDAARRLHGEFANFGK